MSDSKTCRRSVADKTRIRSRHTAGWMFLVPLVVLMMAGCAPRVQETIKVVSIFPPREVMRSQDYATFLKENEEALNLCGETHDCDGPLFNLAFVHVYPLSPFFDQKKGLKHLDTLIEQYPDSPWAYQGRIWVSLIRANVAAEQKKKQLGGKLKSKDTTIKKLREQLERSREIDLEMDQKERELLQ